jgi:hypothetical protein
MHKALFTLAVLVLMIGAATAGTEKLSKYGGDRDFNDVSVDTITQKGGYTRHMNVPIDSAAIGPSAPAFTNCGTWGGLGFDDDADLLAVKWRIPSDWDGESDMGLHLHWLTAAGITDNNTVIWEASYTIAADGETCEGTATALDVTYTQTGGDSVAGTIYETNIPIDYDNGDNPIVVGSQIGLILMRDDSADTDSGTAVLVDLHAEYISTTFPEN